MQFIQWLSELTEDYIATWANKGLVRRGSKQLEKHSLTQHWQLQANSASAQIDEQQQTLNGIGFEKLTCSCPATGPCYHLTCFLLGLQQLAESQNPASTEQPPSTENMPWLLDDLTQIPSYCSKALLNRALRWWHQNIVYQLQQMDTGLHIDIHEKAHYKLFIPRNGGIEGSICSCKQTPCVHLAFALLAVNLEQGLALPEEAHQLHDEWSLYCTTQLQGWLQQLVNRGISGISQTQLSQGEALITELKQADLPNVSKQLAHLLTLLIQLQQGFDHSSIQRIRQPLASLYATLNALHQTPLPQPLQQLAGVHRQNYSLCRHKHCIGIAAEIWQGARNVQGFTLYCLDTQNQHIYQVSESRTLHTSNSPMEIDWSAANAFRHATLGQATLSTLMDAEFTLLRGWLSASGRLSMREGVQLSDVKTVDALALLEHAISLGTLAQQLTNSIQQAIFNRTTAQFALVRITHLNPLIADPYLQQWYAQGIDQQGATFAIRLIADQLGQHLAQQINSHCADTQAIFGRWFIENGLLTVYPIALWDTQQRYQLHQGIETE